ncbi:unnamed protein product [Dicrocoelium dendriticum]|nr:unnamed protein product [Dicrocoelium dendriticum]
MRFEVLLDLAVTNSTTSTKKPVVRDDPDAGLSFYLQINGVPVFAKGANWIPHRLLPGRVSGFMHNSTRDPSWDSKRLLRSAAMTGMNIVRVWGGGRYEPEEFYREADRLGLMIWHDMMFAVSTYPSRESPDPLDTVEKEVRRQVRRLHSHPSIVVWATDNEVRQAIMDNWYGGNRTQLLAAFQDRFVGSVARAITEQERVPKDWIQLEESLKYHPRKCLISSPSNGIVTEQAKGTDRNPQDPRFGDVHYYNYYGNLWLETVYPVTRFTSEFGIQSLPSALAWSRSLSDPTEEVHWDINGSLMKHRQHRAANELFALAAKLIGEPTELSDMKKRYIRWAYLTQLNQMMSYRAHINRLMRHQCRLVGSTVQPDEKSSMGAMYWQLNDVWSAPTWSTIDAAGQWKMAHYGAVTECFRSRRLGRVAVYVNGEQLEVDWIPPNQSKIAVVPDVFVIRCYTIMSLRPTAEWRINVDWQHYDTSCPVPVLTSSLSSMENRCNWTDSNVSGRIVHVSMEKEGEVVDGESYTLLETPAEINWPKRSKDQGARVTQFREIPKSEVDPQAPFTPTSVYALTVETILPELFVWLELNYTLDMEYWFSENAFNLLTTSSRWIHLYVSSSRFVSPERIHSAIILNTLTTIREEHET